MYTLADLVRITELKRRTLQCWADRGILLTAGDRFPGTGAHRQFDKTEATIACLLTPLTFLELSSNMLHRLALELRSTIEDSGLEYVQFSGFLSHKDIIASAAPHLAKLSVAEQYAED